MLKNHYENIMMKVVAYMFVECVNTQEVMYTIT